MEGERKHNEETSKGGRETEMKGKERKHVSVMVCVSTWVCLYMSVVACMHVLLHTFMHECVFVCAAWWVGVVGTARAIYSSSLTWLLAVCLRGTERHHGSPNRQSPASQRYVTTHPTSLPLSSSIPPQSVQSQASTHAFK